VYKILGIDLKVLLSLEVSEQTRNDIILDKFLSNSNNDHLDQSEIHVKEEIVKELTEAHTTREDLPFSSPKAKK
tara:strand:+ start:257 stop:478 length:222 start_codon:yes stop_codon:yes gene_type:complete